MRSHLLASVFVVISAQASAGEEIAFSTWTNAVQEKMMNLPTLGGRIFWGDVVHFRGWRIQQNVVSGRYRLLDPDDARHASGTREECLACLEDIKHDRRLQPLSGKAVILIHGMGRSSKSWPKLTRRLEEKGYLVVGFDYPSTRCCLADSAAYLASVLESLDGVDEINIVGHSMGGLVVRAYLAEHADERIKRLVMLAVPNRGAEMADLVTKVPLYRWVCGPGGCELITDPAGTVATLPTPPFEFAVIAAARGRDDGYNPLIDGDDDGTITVASTRLPGAADFLQVNGLTHSFVMYDERVIDATVRFLETGRLREAGESQPIQREPVEAEKSESQMESQSDTALAR